MILSVYIFLLTLFVLNEGLLLFQFYHFKLTFYESVFFCTIGLISLVSSFWLLNSFWKWITKIVFIGFCLIGLFFNINSKEQTIIFKPKELIVKPIQYTEKQYYELGYNYKQYKNYRNIEYPQELKLWKKKNELIEKQNKSLERQYHERTNTIYDYIFMIARAFFSIIMIFMISSLVDKIKFMIENLNHKSNIKQEDSNINNHKEFYVSENTNIKEYQPLDVSLESNIKQEDSNINNHKEFYVSENTNINNHKDDYDSKNEIINDYESNINLRNEIIKLGKEKYGSKNRKYDNLKIAKMLDCDIRLVNEIFPIRKYKRKKTNLVVLGDNKKRA